MKTSKYRHTGGAYRQFKTNCAAHAKPGKSRAAAKSKSNLHPKNRGNRP